MLDFDIALVYGDEELVNRMKRKLEEALSQSSIYLITAADADSFVADWVDGRRFMDAFVDLRPLDGPDNFHVADLYSRASQKMSRATFVHLINKPEAVLQHGCGLYLHRGPGNVSLAPHAAILYDKELEERLCRALVTTLVSSAISDDLSDLFGSPGQAPFTRTSGRRR